MKDSKDDIEMGIYNHFITDYYWIWNFVKEHKVKDNDILYIKTKDGVVADGVELIYEDYSKMNGELIRKYNLEADFIKDVQYNGILKDMYNMNNIEIYKKIDGHIKNISSNKELEIFTMEEIYQFIEFTKDKVIEKIKQNYRK